MFQRPNQQQQGLVSGPPPTHLRQAGCLYYCSGSEHLWPEKYEKRSRTDVRVYTCRTRPRSKQQQWQGWVGWRGEGRPWWGETKAAGCCVVFVADTTELLYICVVCTTRTAYTHTFTAAAVAVTHTNTHTTHTPRDRCKTTAVQQYTAVHYS